MAYILARAVSYFASFLQIVITIRIFLSWIPILRDSSFARIIYMLTEPILGPIRDIINRSPLGGRGMIIDFSPIFAFFLINLVTTLLIDIISRIGI